MKVRQAQTALYCLRVDPKQFKGKLIYRSISNASIKLPTWYQETLSSFTIEYNMFLCQGYLRRKRPFFDVFKMERRGRYGGKTRKEITHAFLMLPRSCLALVTRKKKGAFLVSYPNPWGASINQKGNEIIVDEDDGQGLHITNLRILINYYSKALSLETHLHVRCKNLTKKKSWKKCHHTCVSAWLSVSISSTSAPSGFPGHEDEG